MHIIKISFWRNKICCYLHYGKEVYPFPTFGNFKWQLIIDTAFNSINLLIIRIIPSENDRFMLVTFDFALFDKLEIEAKKAAIRAEDIAKGVFVPVSSLPQREPMKGVQTA